MRDSIRLKSALLGLFLLANLAVIGWFWWSGSGAYVTSLDPGKLLIAFGRISGLLLVLFVLCQLMLIGRIAWIEHVFGLDKLSRLHHWIGFALLTLLLAHPTLLSLGYGMRTGSGFFQQFLDFQSWENVLLATSAFGLFVFVILISVVIVLRKMKYESWYYIHLAVYLAILLAFSHQLSVGRDLMDPVFAGYWYALYAFVLLNFAYFRFLKPSLAFAKHGFTVDAIENETPDVISIFIRGRDLRGFRFKAGQFLIVRFLAKGFWPQAHPFSLSNAPGSERLRLSIKKSGDYTSSLGRLKPGTKAMLDGPHGVFIAERSCHEKFLFVAGGIGVTPIMSLIASLAPLGKDITLLYACRDSATAAFKTELDDLAAKYSMRVHYIMSNDPAWRGEKGFVDQDKITRLVPDVLERDTYLCGPTPMMAAVRQTLESCGVPRSCIHFEKFSL
ncbi:ferredoxin reductase family protein [Candidatus Uhrbacteria bacterium]|nr:ferredoxin reductase family protein [Candidatus Uhrbacteria bacterium]